MVRVIPGTAPASTRRTLSGALLSELMHRPLSMTAALVIVAFFTVALFADFIASDMPIACSIGDRFYAFPNIVDYASLVDYDNQRVVDEIKDSGGWALFPPVPYGPLQSKVRGAIQWLAPPDLNHLLGTDDRGRDVLARLVHGTRISLAVGVVAVGIYTAIGLFLGALAGYYSNGRIDRLISRLIEVMMSFPTFFLILAIQGLLTSSSVLQLMVVIGLTRWTDVARLVRGEVMRIVTQDYITAARALGLGHAGIIWKHVIPNAMGPVMVAATFGVAGAVIIESALSFLGFGTPPPTASWGELLTQAYHNGHPWWLTLFPGIALFMLVTSYNLVGEAFRDAVDPRLRGRSI